MITKRLKHRYLSRSGYKSIYPLVSREHEQGLTLIECLVAIVIVALVASAIAPALVISVATRVHSQKAEQALALAQSEIENTRVLVERGTYAAANLPPLATGLADKDVETALGPNLTVTNSTSFAYAQPKDINGDGTTDFLVQRYRATGQTVGSTPVAFAMGVRVYDSDVTGAGNLSTNPASLIMTSGNGGRSARPLAVLYTTIATSDKGDSLCNLITYYNSAVSSGKKTLPTVCAAPTP